MKYTIAVLAILLSLSSCKSKKEVETDEVTQEQVKPPRERTLLFKMERTACFGTCPEDVSSFYSDGTIFYESTRYGIVEGRNVGYTDYGEELVELYVNNYSTDYEKKYDDPRISDLPSTILTFYDEYETPYQIIMRANTPTELRTLERRLDEILKAIEKWENIGGVLTPYKLDRNYQSI